MATITTALGTIADELAQHDDCLAHKDWGVELYCNGCDWNSFGITRRVFENEAEAYKAYDEHLAAAIYHRLFGTP